jgi:RNA polymerase sigma factor (sigma-70 family)
MLAPRFEKRVDRMTRDPFDQTRRPSTVAPFPTTSWTQIRDPASLEGLCQAYWRPLYAFLRQMGNDRHKAEDLTQGFFLELLSKHRLRQADQTRGRFRTFLLQGIKNFAHNEWDKETAAKRGGKHTNIPIDTAEADSRMGVNPIDRSADPVAAFERQWALTVLEQARTSLTNQYTREGKANYFGALAPFLTGDGGDYTSVAVRLGVKEGALRTAVSRLRREYRQALREEVGRTVDAQAEVDAELKHLLAVLSRR